MKSADSQDLQETPEHLRKNTCQVKHFKMSTRKKSFRIKTFSGKNVFKKEKRKKQNNTKKSSRKKMISKKKKDGQRRVRLLMSDCECRIGLGTCRSWTCGFVLDSDLTVFDSELVGPDLRCSESWLWTFNRLGLKWTERRTWFCFLTQILFSWLGPVGLDSVCHVMWAWPGHAVCWVWCCRVSGPDVWCLNRVFLRDAWFQTVVQPETGAETGTVSREKRWERSWNQVLVLQQIKILHVFVKWSKCSS